jgi:16S rRNA C967 or C1407 C5-methylase (RsmB/RsmF family)/NOL1/NOP2/fmu family ribosome biogenesis protein
MTIPALPAAFLDAMRAQLGPEIAAFLDAYAEPPVHGLSVNPAKTSLEELRARTGWRLEPAPWCPTGAYIDPGSRPGAHPYHAAGLYYLQEPSAMAVAELADIEPGQTVLDLAAAPGGKSTQVASAIGRHGLLVANEIHPARIRPFGENLERWGATRAVITNADPDRLARLGPVFDRVIVDAPCSGEGLFRRDPAARAEWSPARVTGSAGRQREILATALELVRPGGALIYSTCTFNEQENEAVIAAALAGRTDFGVDERLRLWPHRVRAEGHVISRLVRGGESLNETTLFGGSPSDPDPQATWLEFVERTLLADPIADAPGFWRWQGDRLMLATGHGLDLAGITVVRDGLWAGERKPGRFEPSHALALALSADVAAKRLDLDVDGARRWIAGEPVAAAGPPGWLLVTVDGHPLGWGKRTGATVKNHYPKGLRRSSRAS